MKQLDDGLLAHLQSGATTLCWCWRLTRRDGSRLGFTDHDRDLAFDGTTFEAASGFTASEIREQVGLSVDNLEVAGALISDRLSEIALAAGDFDDAAIEIFRVNWQETAQRVLARKGSLGEVRRAGAAFTAEVRGLAHYLQQPRGRLFQYTCDADLGDARCGIDLDQPTYRASGTIIAVSDARRILVDGLADYATGWFTRGMIAFTSGANTGRAMEIKAHTARSGHVEIELWQPMGEAIAIGDAITVTAGCDKRFETCAARFANALNYRGFPHMPGNDFVTAVAQPGNTPRPNGTAFQNLELPTP
jgi:uncharacterized phage protein (TIGR02218 family)